MDWIDEICQKRPIGILKIFVSSYYTKSCEQVIFDMGSSTYALMLEYRIFS
jgi:hypothetical protein